MLDFQATNYAYNSQNAFTNFCLMKKEAYTPIKEQIISYNWKNIVIKFRYLDVIFINILYTLTLIYNLYSVSYLCYYRWDINIKPLGKTIFIIGNKIICYEDEI